MIKRSAEMPRQIRENMRGGAGSVLNTELLAKGEYEGACRLVGTLTMKKGDGIGEHVHENEEEIFYVVSGTAHYNDNGKEEILCAGDSCICNKGQLHSIRNEDDELLVVVAIILTF